MASQTISDEVSVTFPQPGTDILEPGRTVQSSSSHQQKGVQQKTLKRKSKVLGVFQILIGTMILVCGIKLTLSEHPPYVSYSGYPVFGGLFFIVSGVVLVSVKRKNKKCLVWSILEMNIINIIISGLGIIFLLINLVAELLAHYHWAPRLDLASVIGLTSTILILTLLEFVTEIFFPFSRCGVTHDFGQNLGQVPADSSCPEKSPSECHYQSLTSHSPDYEELRFQK
ncbi:membrane-spanning 4-domains subfamily A member 12-like [Ornithorhynchus anatinus]|uniref:membrane-spanning 4-domains subfamily A member 12-like n=1 Tax=Ornithorhynchus anatinus TaxID=9258 RepID=UPI0010A826BD|nr:membrane-spanning 4-domains subfamily A member 12-like [Ornithorhynchus anatinus]